MNGLSQMLAARPAFPRPVRRRLCWWPRSSSGTSSSTVAQANQLDLMVPMSAVPEDFGMRCHGAHSRSRHRSTRSHLSGPHPLLPMAPTMAPPWRLRQGPEQPSPNCRHPWQLPPWPPERCPPAIATHAPAVYAPAHSDAPTRGHPGHGPRSALHPSHPTSYASVATRYTACHHLPGLSARTIRLRSGGQRLHLQPGYGPHLLLPRP